MYTQAHSSLANARRPVGRIDRTQAGCTSHPSLQHQSLTFITKGRSRPTQTPTCIGTYRFLAGQARKSKAPKAREAPWDDVRRLVYQGYVGKAFILRRTACGGVLSCIMWTAASTELGLVCIRSDAATFRDSQWVAYTLTASRGCPHHLSTARCHHRVG